MPDLSRLTKLIEPMPAYGRLIETLKGRSSNENTVVVLDAARPYLVAALYESLRVPLLLVTAQPENARKLQEQLSSWSNSQPLLFPEPDVLPYERLASDSATEMERVRVLTILSGAGGDNSPGFPLVVASAAALMSKTPAQRDFVSSCHSIGLGMNQEPLRLLAAWESMGYRLENVVEVPGAVSHRGGIIDIWPPTSETPVRLEFFGDTIDSIRVFDPETQRSTDKLESISIGPASELIAPRRLDKLSLEGVLHGLDLSGLADDARQAYQRDTSLFLEGQVPPEAQFYTPLFNSGSLLDYLPPGTLIILDEPSSIEQAALELDSEAAQLRSGKLERGELPPNFPHPVFYDGKSSNRR